MIELESLKFDDTLNLLYGIKCAKGHKTLNETYESLQQTSIDSILDVLCISYNLANKTSFSTEEFANEMSLKGVGFVKLTNIFTQLIQSLMFSGLSKEEEEASKKQLANLTNKSL